MANIIRSYYDAYGLESLTAKINLIPNQWDTINQLGIFPTTPEGVITDSVAVDVIEYQTPTIVDMVRGTRSKVGRDDKRSKKVFGIGHFPIEDIVTARDVKGRTGYGTEAPEMVADAVARKMMSIRRGYAQLREIQRAQILKDGTAYAPNSTVSVNYYTEFGVTRKEIDMDFTDALSDLKGKIEEGISHIRLNLLSGLYPITGFVAICHPTFFDALTGHSKIIDAYSQYQSDQEPLRNRLDGSGIGKGLPNGSRMFRWAGVLFVEHDGTMADGTPYMTAGEARLIPTGAFDLFRSYAAPSEKMSDIHTFGKEMYMYQYIDPRDEGIILEAESNVLDVVVRPQCIVRLYTT